MKQVNADVTTGAKYGRLTVIHEAGKRNGRRYFLCICTCGIQKVIMAGNLKQGNVKSCGCLRLESTQNITHGKTGTRLYRIWTGIKTRCLNKNDKTYKRYGARGIKVFDAWLSFEGFYQWAINSGYKKA